MTTPTVSLTVQKILPCRPAEAFRAWTTPEQLQQWFVSCQPGDRVTAAVDLRPGGKYRFTFVHPDGRVKMIVDGEFLVIRAPHYLEYTWSWAEPAVPGAPNRTVVKVVFRELGAERTELVLTHDGFTDPEDCENHTEGWTRILDCMAADLGAARPGA